MTSPPLARHTVAVPEAAATPLALQPDAVRERGSSPCLSIFITLPDSCAEGCVVGYERAMRTILPLEVPPGCCLGTLVEIAHPWR